MSAAHPLALVDFDWPAADGVAREARGTRLVVRSAEETLVAAHAAEVPVLLARVDAWARAGHYAVGWVAYEAAPAFDAAFPRREPRAGAPLAAFHLVRADAVARELAPGSSTVTAASPLPDAEAWVPDESRVAHERAVEAVRAAIGRGDVYQVNHTLRLRAPWRSDPLAAYEALRAAHRPPYAAYLRVGDQHLLSLSPELFLARHGRHLTTRPMKGTAPRGRWPIEDEMRRAALRVSEKERAENVMIVDLLRNDLGRVAAPGGVEVVSLFDAERYPTVWQLTSTVRATSAAPVPVGDAFAALFPCGSVTGAPKIAAMQAIARLERAPRGAYCGAVGVVLPGGDYVFNVAIRTVEVDAARGTAAFGVGSGVTWDSTPDGEYDELLAKRALLAPPPPAFALLETLRLTHGAYPLLERHLARMAASAAYFGRPLDADAARTALAAHAAAHPAAERRVRLLVHDDGHVQVESTPLAPEAGPWRVALAAAPVDARDAFLFHKTTHRAVYDRALAAARAADPSLDDVILRNGSGELTELTRANLVLELDGACWTPPVRCGLLGGVQRAAALDAGRVRERVLVPADLARATRAWALNSVRGWVPLVLPSSGAAAA